MSECVTPVSVSPSCVTPIDGDPTTPVAAGQQLFWNTEQSYEASCPEGYSGDPVTVVKAANTYSSLVDQATADALALAAATSEAEAGLVCVLDAFAPDPIYFQGIWAFVVEDGNIITTGIDAGSTLWVRKYTPTGTLVWEREVQNGASGEAVAILADGRYILGGDFTRFDDTGLDIPAYTASGATQYGCVVLDPETGAVDNSFAIAANDRVHSIAVQADGKVILTGVFTSFGGVARNRIVRLTSALAVDTGFNPGASGGSGIVICVKVLASGDIAFGGSFTTLAGASRSNIGIVDTLGVIVSAFNPGANDLVRVIAEVGASVLVGGNFSTIAGTARAQLGSVLTANGAINSAFNAQLGRVSGTPAVYAILVHSNGDVYVGGYFNLVAGAPRVGAVRVNVTTGVWQTSFDPTVQASCSVYSIVETLADRMFVAGVTLNWEGFGASPTFALARIDEDGGLA